MHTLSQITHKADAFKKLLANKPIRENFGDREVRLLDEYIGFIYDYPHQERQPILQIRNQFYDWCMNYIGSTK